MATKKTAEVEKTTYLLTKKGGTEQKVSVPSKWRLTFGPTTPYERKNGGYGNGQEVWALRFYEGTKLKAIFTDVQSFRELGSITIEEKVVRVSRQRMQKGGRTGGKEVVAEAKVEEWINPDDPDEPDEEFKTLEFKPSDFETL